MDATQFAESDYLTVEIVKNSKSKQAVVVGNATIEATEYGDKLQILVEIDEKQKKYKPNKDSVKNIIQAYGGETKGWLGKVLFFNIVTIMGKESIVAAGKK